MILRETMESTNSWRCCIFEVLLLTQFCFGIELHEDSEVVRGQYCNSEIFQPRCLTSEVIVIRNATYGRMAIGECIKAEQIKAFGHLGCSTDVVHLLEEKCSGKRECDISVAQINDQLKVKPCVEGLIVYLEASYECIRVADESRSCSVEVSINPVYLTNPRICGTNEQPWMLEAPFGQKISVDLVMHRQSTRSPQMLQPRCRRLGTIVDGAAKRNTTICANEQETQTTSIYKSSGNTLQIFLDSSSKHEKPIGRGITFFIKLHAVGCIDIIPPEDAYLKRTGDALVIGCYTSRSTWHLECRDGRWIGVVGNCSQHVSMVESFEKPEIKLNSMSSEHIVGLTALSGFVLVICLAVACIGAVCYRRFRFNSRKKLNGEYGVSLASHAPQSMDLRIPFGTNAGLIGNDSNLFESKQHPTYSVFVGEDGEGGCGGLQELSVSRGC